MTYKRVVLVYSKQIIAVGVLQPDGIIGTTLDLVRNTLLGFTPDPLNQKLWGWGGLSVFQQIFPDDSDAMKSENN